MEELIGQIVGILQSNPELSGIGGAFLAELILRKIPKAPPIFKTLAWLFSALDKAFDKLTTNKG